MPDSYAALVTQLWQIKNRNAHTIGQMAKEAGLNSVTLWRIMQGQRRPNFDTTAALLRAYPELGGIFLSTDSPDGNDRIPDGVGVPS